MKNLRVSNEKKIIIQTIVIVEIGKKTGEKIYKMREGKNVHLIIKWVSSESFFLGKLDAWEGGLGMIFFLNNSPGSTFLEEVKNKRLTT
jgi:hypothetical protein